MTSPFWLTPPPAGPRRCVRCPAVWRRCPAKKATRPTSRRASRSSTSAPAASALSEEKVNINTASKEELIGLNGIGEVLADRIIEYREANGGYKDVRELTNVKGIGEKLLEKLLPYVTV